MFVAHFLEGRTIRRSALTLAAALAASGVATATEPPRPATFAKDVAPILQQKCQHCHQPGSIAPMSLRTFEETRPWARAIKDRVMRRQMPPWHIDRTVGVQSFKNDMSLSDDQIDTIVRWVDAGAPLGDPKDMPPPKPLVTDNEWVAVKDGLGKPDLVIKADPFTMPAQHQDVWWRPLADIGLTEPRWVKAVEIRPSTLRGRRIVHHAVAYLVQDDDPGSINQGTVAAVTNNSNREELAGRRAQFMEWAIGKGYDLYRPDTGKLLLPGSKISWDIHIHAVGEEITDGVEMGVWLYPKGEEPKHRTYLIPFTGLKSRAALDIPPNSLAQTEGFTILKEPAVFGNFQPHMHLRGRAMELEAILPDGTQQVISYVGNFNFNWMTNYIYADDAAPVLPRGTVIHVTAWHDNTKTNKNNPDADQWVGWGDRTVDEMAHAWVNVTYLTDEEYKALIEQRKAAASDMAPQPR
ncbi:MAG TPA: cytochrome c [Vicinamibacterales bacterium]|nr:cytochrome c [Vicinamibacterales bacterium]